MTIGDVDPCEFYLDAELKEFRAIFDKYDTSGDGSVDAAEMQQVFQAVGVHLKQFQVEQIVREFDIDGSGEIEFEEFMVMMIKLLNRRVRADCIDYRDYLADALIARYEQMFRTYDVSGDGSINREELEDMLAKLNINMTALQIDEVIAEVDKDGSGEIEFDEFLSMMAKLGGSRKKIRPREYIDRETLDQYRQVFAYFDKDNSGEISVKELDQCLRKMNVVLRPDQVNQLLAKYDDDQSGAIEFPEFAAMLIDLKKLRRKCKISPETTDALTLRLDGFTATEVKCAGFEAQAMKDAGYGVKPMSKSGFQPISLRRAGFSATDLRLAGRGAHEMKRVGYSLTDLRNAGYSALACRVAAQYQHKTLADVPHYAQHLLPTAPAVADHLTPRIRHFTDRELQVSKKNRVNHNRVAPRSNMLGGVARGILHGTDVDPNQKVPDPPKKPGVTIQDKRMQNEIERKRKVAI